jgi:hypothetical protein
MRFLFIVVLILSFCCSVEAQVLSGGVEYNTTSAREELLASDIPTIPKNLLNLHIYDNEVEQNHALLLKGVAQTQDRILASFSDGSYAIVYNDNPLYTWYYSPDGFLTHSEVKTSIDYPFKAYKYNLAGKLVNMNLRPSKDETFIFTKDGKLLAHWKFEKCFDENGNVIMTRKYSTEK